MSLTPESTRDGDTTPSGKGHSRSPGSVHWLVRVAERAGLSGGDALDVPPGTPARDAWPVITRAFLIRDGELAELVA